jgi:hypothetical protein
MNVKSERLKKLETELKDLQQWLKLGLVPKKDLEKHAVEIQSIEQRIEEEKERLRYLKENDELEYIAPKRNQAPRSGFQEAHTIPDINLDETSITDAGLDLDNDTFSESETVAEDSEETMAEDITSLDDDDDPFSDSNRWRRGVFEDPDSNNGW